MGNFNLSKYITEKEMPMIFLRFYLVGLLLFFIPFTRTFFILITWITLLLVIGVIMYFHRRWNLKTIFYFLCIVTISFFIEMAGTTGGEIFGQYYYDIGLGPQMNHTPLIIGINWLFLVYASHDIAERVTKNPFIRILLGATLMVMYDLIMEWVASPMRMWHFDTSYPPLQNFISWFVIAFIFHSGFELLRIKTDNKASGILFGMQAVLFLLIGIYSSIFIR